MKIFSITGRKHISKGVNLDKHPSFGLVVSLGESGRGRQLTTVALDRHNPPKYKEEAVSGFAFKSAGRITLFDAHPKQITIRRGEPNERSFWTLEAARNDGVSVLVRVSTQGTYTRSSYGSYKVAEGEPVLIAEGHGAHGDAGRIGGWADGLWVMKRGDVLRVTPEGGKFKGMKPYALYIAPDGNPAAVDWDEYEELIAMGADLPCTEFPERRAAKPITIELNDDEDDF